MGVLPEFLKISEKLLIFIKIQINILMEYYTIIIDWLSGLKPVELTIVGGAMTALGSFFVFLWKKFTKPKSDIKVFQDNDIESHKTTMVTLNTGVSVTGTVHGPSSLI